MSTEAAFQDEEGFKAAMADVRNDGSETNYVIIGHIDSNPNLIGVIATGGDFEDLQTAFPADQMMYALIRISTKVDMSDTVKFVYIHWIGDSIPFVKKGRFGVVHGDVKQHFQPCHMEIELSSTDDLQEDNIRSLLSNVEGTKDKSVETSSIDPTQHRSFIGRGDTKAKSANAGPLLVGPQGVDVPCGEGIAEAITDIRNDESQTNWCLVGYEGGNPKSPLQLLGCGSEGVSGIVSMLEEDKVMFGMCRVNDTVDDIATVKFVYIVWIGDNVKPMTKAKASTQKSSVEKLFSPHHASIFACDLSDVTEERIMDIVTAGSGSKSFVM